MTVVTDYKTFLPLITNNPEYKIYLPLVMTAPEYKTYLPLVMNAPNPPEAPAHKLYFPMILNGAPGPTTFRIDHVRLWPACQMPHALITAPLARMTIARSPKGG